MSHVRDVRHRLDRVAVWDLTLGLACLGVAVVVHLGGSEAVARNLEPSWFSVLLTILAVGPLVVRHRYPLTVLALTLSGLLLLIATRNTVGAATLGCIVALYTVVAVAPRRRAVLGAALMVVAVAAGLVMRPVDLSSGGAVVHLVIFTGAAVLGYTVRERRESFEAEMVAAQEQAARSAADERARITRELHDIIGHAMSVMVVQAGVAEQLVGTDPDRARTRGAARSARPAAGRSPRCGSSSRRCATTSRTGRRPPPRPDADPRASCRRSWRACEAAGLPGDAHGATASRGAAAARARAGGVPRRAGGADQLPQARRRHAGRRRPGSTSRRRCVRVAVVDDGRRRRTPAPAPTGQGLVGMRERVAVYGGELRRRAGDRAAASGWTRDLPAWRAGA